MKRRALLTLALLPWLAHAQAGLAERLRKRLPGAAVQRGQFEQLKTVAGFKHPLRSQGDYLLARGQGVVWRIREPFVQTLVLTPEALRSEAGPQRSRLDERNAPGLAQVNRILFALLAADLDALAQGFEASGQVPDQGLWTLHLVPREATLARWLREVTLQGDQQVQRVRWQEAGGDVTELRFAPQPGPAQLTAEEAARFD